ncbi:MAG: dihydrolipoamide dehydrogenase [Flavobacteriaceae bacterium]|nr:dihydrolipoamide dehydrogenase [Flavobacteriaceae bacterium]
MKKTIITLLLSLSISTFLYSQLRTPAPSPKTKIHQQAGLTDFTIEYARPAKRGRAIFGNLVPYGELWRTGANENTLISVSEDILLNEKKLTKGLYSLYTIPGKEKWEIIFYKSTDNWGLPAEFKEEMVVLRIQATAKEINHLEESLSIYIGDITNNFCSLNLHWDTTLVQIPIQLMTKEIAVASILKVLNSSPTTSDYYRAAQYYHEEKLELSVAKSWIDTATNGNTNAYWMYRLKSLIYKDLGDIPSALKAAETSLEIAERAGNMDYVRMNNDFIAANR